MTYCDLCHWPCPPYDYTLAAASRFAAGLVYVDFLNKTYTTTQFRDYLPCKLIFEDCYSQSKSLSMKFIWGKQPKR